MKVTLRHAYPHIKKSLFKIFSDEPINHKPTGLKSFMKLGYLYNELT